MSNEGWIKLTNPCYRGSAAGWQIQSHPRAISFQLTYPELHEISSLPTSLPYSLLASVSVTALIWNRGLCNLGRTIKRQNNRLKCWHSKSVALSVLQGVPVAICSCSDILKNVPCLPCPSPWIFAADFNGERGSLRTFVRIEQIALHSSSSSI